MIKQLYKSVRVWILIICVLMAIVAISPNPWAKGVAIRGVEKNSSAELAGFVRPEPSINPMNRERILEINNIKITNVADYYSTLETIGFNRTITVKTNRKSYSVITAPPYISVPTNETVEKNITSSVFDNSTNTTRNITKTVEDTVYQIIYLTNQSVDIGLAVYDAPKTNIRKGLELQGGTRVLLRPEEKLDPENLDILLSNMKERLNVYGLSDIIVRPVSDLYGNQYIVVEIAGANEQEVKDLISKQGKFEAKIGNETVFKGGLDITYVCRSSQCAFAVDPRQPCGQMSDGRYTCRFSFSISISPEAAKRQADLTRDLEVVRDVNKEGYLSQPLDLYLDDQLVDTLQIGADLKGRDVTEIAISGSGVGKTKQEAAMDSATNMKKMQTILITGSLPVKLSIVKTDNVSPTLGEEFFKNALIIGIISILAVTGVIYIRYRVKEIIVPIVVTMIAEILLLFGFAAVIGWNIDIAAIAGIIAAVGTGVDDQIVITDETLRGERQETDWRKRFKKAFFIIMAAWTVTVVSMIPLWFAGAGLLRGLALTTIVGVSIGVFITRPAFAAIVEILLKK